MKRLIKKLYNPWNLFILIILLIAFILRIYRIEALLDFHYDQGRDAKIIWDLWHSGKLFLIGPTTGLDGIFLGPFYYYLIAIPYYLSAGNPVIVSMFLSLLVTVSLYVLYLTGVEIGGKPAGFVALVIATFSNYLVFSSRWLSNPTPIYLTSILIFYNMVLILKKSKPSNWYWIYLLVGLSLQLELASAIFYLPILLIFTIWKREKLNTKTFLISVILLFLTLVPQLWFNFKHDNILLRNIKIEISNDNKVKLDLMSRSQEIWKITKRIF